MGTFATTTSSVVCLGHKYVQPAVKIDFEQCYAIGGIEIKYGIDTITGQ